MWLRWLRDINVFTVRTTRKNTGYSKIDFIMAHSGSQELQKLCFAALPNRGRREPSYIYIHTKYIYAKYIYDIIIMVIAEKNWTSVYRLHVYLAARK